MGDDRLLYGSYRNSARYSQKIFLDEIEKIEDAKRRKKVKKAAESYGNYVDDLFRKDEEECKALRQQAAILQDIDRHPIDFIWEKDIETFRSLKWKIEDMEKTYEERKKVLKEREEEIKNKIDKIEKDK